MFNVDIMIINKNWDRRSILNNVEDDETIRMGVLLLFYVLVDFTANKLNNNDNNATVVISVRRGFFWWS